MNKRFVRKEVEYRLDWEGSVSIEQIEKDLSELKKLGATHVLIDTNCTAGDADLDIVAVTERLETDEELQERVRRELRLEEINKAREREMLEQLKKKYE